MRPTLYFRALRHASLTVFCVENGQKTAFDPVFGRSFPYGSGQQAKRSVLDSMCEHLGVPRSPTIFNVRVNDRGAVGNGEAWSACDPRDPDQLVGGWMKAGKGEGGTIRRAGALDISAVHPLHTLLAAVHEEAITFDRSTSPGTHRVRVTNSKDEELSEAQIAQLVEKSGRSFPARLWMPEQKRANGLFIVEGALDLSRLFRVSLDPRDPELATDMVTALEADGWTRSEDGEFLRCPAEKREPIAASLAYALTHWRSTSNQSRTYSAQPMLAIALCTSSPGVLVDAIRADLVEGERLTARPVIEPLPGVELFASLSARAIVPAVEARADAMDAAQERIRSLILELAV
jgi:hypothetical protein